MLLKKPFITWLLSIVVAERCGMFWSGADGWQSCMLPAVKAWMATKVRPLLQWPHPPVDWQHYLSDWNQIISEVHPLHWVPYLSPWILHSLGDWNLKQRALAINLHLYIFLTEL
jgi:hypothetical protein